MDGRSGEVEPLAVMIWGMSDTLSHSFIAGLYESRNELYERACAGSASPAAAEAALHQAARALFVQYSNGSVHSIPGAMLDALNSAPAAVAASSTLAGVSATAITATAMPADVWARLTAVIQVEAARSTNSAALHPDSVLLSPDPLLAPKKKSASISTDEGPTFSFRQILLFAAIALVLGTAITLYLVTRPAAPRPHPPTAPSNSTGTSLPT
jgi:hypothetical protein